MKQLYIIGIVSAVVALSGCGSSSSSSQGSATSVGPNSNVIQVVRGPILGAIVKDTQGQLAKDLKDGKGSYSFNGTINYPITATGGVIDIDRDGKVSVGDVKNDLNLTTNSGNVITMLTTYSLDSTTKTMLENVAKDFNVSLTELESKTPLDSKEVEAISNIMYKFAQDNNITKDTTSEIEKEIKSEYTKYSETKSHDSAQVEKELMDRLSQENKVQTLEMNEVEDEVTNLENKYKIELNKYEKEYGDSEYVSSGSYSSHHQGESCLKCHGIGGIANEVGEAEEAGENQFTSGGTIFAKLNAKNSTGIVYADGYTIRLVLENVGTIMSYNQGRGTGNSNASFSTGTINNYTAEVVNPQGTVVNKSLKNSHDVTRLDCNKCHTSAGANGAPGRIVTFNYYDTPVITTPTNTSSASTTGTSTPNSTGSSISTPPAIPTTTTVVKKSFASDILPILNNKCKACHGSSGRFTITNSASPYNGVKAFVNNANATSSRLLQKASQTISHGGGIVIATTSSEYVTIRDWISEGANNN